MPTSKPTGIYGAWFYKDVDHNDNGVFTFPPPTGKLVIYLPGKWSRNYFTEEKLEHLIDDYNLAPYPAIFIGNGTNVERVI